MVENFCWDGSNLDLVWKKPFDLVAKRPIFHNGRADPPSIPTPLKLRRSKKVSEDTADLPAGRQGTLHCLAEALAKAGKTLFSKIYDYFIRNPLISDKIHIQKLLHSAY